MSDPDQVETALHGDTNPGRARGAGPSRIGRYEIVREIGRGAMGIVYAATDPRVGRTVALKVLHAHESTSSEAEEFHARFFREARTAGMLAHRNIVVVHDVEHDAEIDRPYIAMEILNGPSMREWFRNGHAFTSAHAIDIVVQVAEGLDHAHRQGIVHRDVKPDNLMLLADGTVKITDFGIASIAASNLTRGGQFMGTPSYMSPEQIACRIVDARSDLWSLGVVLYELLTGERPFSGPSISTLTYQIVHVDAIPPSHIRPDVPVAFDAIVSTLLQRDPALRYQTGRDLAEALRALAGTTTTNPGVTAGATGATGPQGSAGEAGATGSRGATGAVGVAGATGERGDAGATGSTGLTGAIGGTGATGARGVEGKTGGVGPTGAAVTGATGPQGRMGPAGTSVRGVAGRDGTRGETGARGTTGQDASSVFGSGTLSATTGTYVLVPGLTASVTIASPSVVVIVEARGGIMTTALGEGGSIVDVAIFVDGVQVPDGGVDRVTCRSDSFAMGTRSWHLGLVPSLSPGPHVVAVHARLEAGSPALVSGPTHDVRQGTLTLITLNR